MKSEVTSSPMKTFKRMALGLISSLLLTAGLARAAQSLDPLSKSIATDQSANRDITPAPSCSAPCYFTPAPSCSAPCYFAPAPSCSAPCYLADK
jgi:hypothetical protein